MLKTLMQHLDGIPDSVVVGMSVPRATPIVYDLGEDMRPLRPPDVTTSISADLIAVDHGIPPCMTKAALAEVNAY